MYKQEGKWRITDAQGRHIEGNIETKLKAEQIIKLWETVDKRNGDYKPNQYKLEQQ